MENPRAVDHFGRCCLALSCSALTINDFSRLRLPFALGGVVTILTAGSPQPTAPRTPASRPTRRRQRRLTDEFEWFGMGTLTRKPPRVRNRPGTSRAPRHRLEERDRFARDSVVFDRLAYTDRDRRQSLSEAYHSFAPTPGGKRPSPKIIRDLE